MISSCINSDFKGDKFFIRVEAGFIEMMIALENSDRTYANFSKFCENLIKTFGKIWATLW